MARQVSLSFTSPMHRQAGNSYPTDSKHSQLHRETCPSHAECSRVTGTVSAASKGKWSHLCPHSSEHGKILNSLSWTLCHILTYCDLSSWIRPNSAWDPGWTRPCVHPQMQSGSRVTWREDTEGLAEPTGSKSTASSGASYQRWGSTSQLLTMTRIGKRTNRWQPCLCPSLLLYQINKYFYNYQVCLLIQLYKRMSTHKINNSQ